MRTRGAVALIGAALALAGCDRVPLLCRDTLIAGAISPDGKRVANLVVRDCHYTTGYTTHLTLRTTRDTRQGPTVAAFSGARPPTLAWRGPQRLLVSPDAGSKVLYQKLQWGGVTLEYRPAPKELKSEGTK